jgi:hypothetical protein
MTGCRISARSLSTTFEEAPGVVGPTFDLYNVYRYTHDDPENVDYYFEQLHKSLFDLEEVRKVLGDGGYAAQVTFTYVFPREEARVNLGFYATPGPTPVPHLCDRASEFLCQFDARFLRLDTLRFSDTSTRSELRARLAPPPLRLRLRPLTGTVARRLARI